MFPYLFSRVGRNLNRYENPKTLLLLRILFNRDFGHNYIVHYFKSRSASYVYVFFITESMHQLKYRHMHLLITICFIGVSIYFECYRAILSDLRTVALDTKNLFYFVPIQFAAVAPYITASRVKKYAQRNAYYYHTNGK